MATQETVLHDSWTSFVERSRSTEATGRLFRGQSDSNWQLQTTWQRYSAKLDHAPHGHYKKLLDEFKLGLLSTQPESKDWPHDYLIAYGRHYGLITQTFDWTQDPLIAAFFAFAGRITPELPIDLEQILLDHDDSVAIWELSGISQLRDRKPPMYIADIPSGLLNRFKAQNAEMIYLDSDEAGHNGLDDLEQLIEYHTWLDCTLTKHTIPVSETLDALDWLIAKDIHFAKLFPDVEGAAKNANLIFKLGGFYNLKPFRKWTDANPVTDPNE